MGSERRRFPRAPQPLEVRYRVGEVESGWHVTTALNVSAGGVRFRSELVIEQGTKLEVRLVMPGLEEPLELLGLVVWSRLQTPEVQELGVEFLNVTPEQQVQIDQVVSFLSRRV